MTKIKQSLSWWCYARKVDDPSRLIKKAAEIGYASIEMLSEDLWPQVKDAGMEIAIIGGHGTLTNGLNKRENHSRIADELHRNIDKAAENGIPSLIAFSGNREGLSDEEGAEITAEGLRPVMQHAEENGVTICIELLNSKVNHPDYQCDRTEWGVKVCKMVGSDRCKLLYDIYHMQIMEGDLIRTIRENHPYFGHYHTAGNPGRNDMDETQEIYYPPVMRAIAETGYTGYVGHEFVPKGDVYEAIRAAYETCNV
ncbi:MAG: TIM barrel protein [Armatimonadetes bacterium]|nr:TIM barrel protein [Armatimonadota bacterium]